MLVNNFQSRSQKGKVRDLFFAGIRGTDGKRHGVVSRWSATPQLSGLRPNFTTQHRSTEAKGGSSRLIALPICLGLSLRIRAQHWATAQNNPCPCAVGLPQAAPEKHWT